jgi:acylphosphatase
MIAHMIVHGRVQGVGFRFTVMQKAMEEGINGWVRNREDGTVEIEAEGTKEQLDHFIQTIKTGLTGVNRFIKITDLEIEFREETKGYPDFRIRY